MKTPLIATTIAMTLSCLLLVGCGAEEKKHPTSSTPESSTPQIEIVASENTHAIKIAESPTPQPSQSGQHDTYYYDYHIKSAYDPTSKPANADASVRVKPRTAIEANMNIRSPYEHVQVSLLVKRLSKNFMVKCSACHDDYANGVIGPSLLGKSSDEIFDAIDAFKTGVKQNVLMDGLIAQMSSEQIRKLADEIYNFNKQIKALRR